MEKAIIIGSSSPNLLGVIESLSLGGICSYLILLGKSNNMFVTKSKYVIGYHICQSQDEVVPYLLNSCTGNERTVVFTANDKAACIIDRNVDALTPYFILPSCLRRGGINNLVDKWEMALLAEQVCMKIPETWICRGGIPSEVIFPCIVKLSASIFGGKTYTKICYSLEELETHISGVCHGKDVIIQKFIKKEYEFQFLGCSLDAGEKIFIPGRTHIVRPNGIENGFFLEYKQIEDNMSDVLGKAKKFIKETKYSGLFSMEFLRGKDGQIYFTEMNFRNDGNSFCVTAAGFNLPLVWYNHCLNRSIESIVNRKFQNKVCLFPENKCFSALLRKEITLREFISYLRRADCYYLFYRHDWMPVISYWYNDILSTVWVILKKFFHK